MNLGAHISMSGGIYNIFERASEATANSIQLFVTNQNRWTTQMPHDKDIDLFYRKRNEFKPYSLITHSRYLINLCSTDPVTEEKSKKAFYEELKLCDILDIPYLVIHPGSYKDKNEQWGLDKIIENMDQVIRMFDNLKCTILLENTAGQGTNLGYTFEQLNYLLVNSKYRSQLAVCFDTCHAFTAGYDIKDNYRQVFADFDKIIGIEMIKAFHLNDSKKELGSKKDRHEHIGQGELGIEPFKQLVNDPRFSKVPMVLETPKGENNEMDIINLKTLRDLRDHK